MLLASLLFGTVAAVITGRWLLVAIASAVALVLPLLLSALGNRELELVQALDRWVLHRLGGRGGATNTEQSVRFAVATDRCRR